MRHPDLSCPNRTCEWLTEHMADTVRDEALIILGDYLSSWQDKWARAKMDRQILELAQRCEAEMERDALRLWREAEDQRDFTRRGGEGG